MKKCISLCLALILTLTVIVVPAMAETTIKIGELTYLNSDGTSRSGMLAEALNAIQSYSGGFQIFGNTYVLNDDGAATPVEIDHVEAVEFDSLNSMVMSLDAGTIDGMIVYFTVGSYLCRENENLTSWLEYSEMEKVYGEEMTNIKNRFILDQILGTDFTFLMMEDHVAIRDEFNQAIADMKADGTLDALRASIMDLNKVEIKKIDNAETIRVGITGDLPPIDYVDEGGVPAGYNTAVLAEISKRIGKNIELVSIDSGARSVALSQGIVDVVFWSRINTPDQSIFDSLPEKRKVDATMIALALAPYRHPDIDIPEGTITTDVYFHDIYVTLYLKK
jgi:ABC-type amino acid transport substrate-binding protein